jgi:electron transport complex protein RnfG
MINPSVKRNTLILSLFAIATAAMLAFTNEGTKELVRCNKQQVLQDSLQQVMPPAQHDNQLLTDFILVDDALLGRETQKVYRARQGDEPAGVVMEATAPDGYGGAIDLLVGVDAAGQVLGVRAVPPHNETPGLGDKIELKKSDWVLSFDGKSLGNPDSEGWAVKKDGGDFDSFTGATITPRAVVAAVYSALEFYARERDSLYQREAAPAQAEDCK